MLFAYIFNLSVKKSIVKLLNVNNNFLYHLSDSITKYYFKNFDFLPDKKIVIILCN